MTGKTNTPRILICSVHGALRYLAAHLGGTADVRYPENHNTFAVISLQDSPPNQYGFVCTESRYCEGVLTLTVDDITGPCSGLQLMTAEHAQQIIAFLDRHRGVSELLIHCRAGISRSAAVGAFAREYYGQPPFSERDAYIPNAYIYQLLCRENHA